MEDTMNIAFITDDNYAMPTVIAITSLVYNKNVDDKYRVFVLCSNISYESKNKLLETACADCEINIIELSDSEMLAGLELPALHVSTAALYKFSLAKLFPNYNRLLYLDGDTRANSWTRPTIRSSNLPS